MSRTTLSDFLSKFSPNERENVSILDPRHTFDVSFKFYPAKATDGGSLKDSGQKQIQQTQQSSAASEFAAGQNYENGKPKEKEKGVIESRNSFDKVNRHTFLEYLAKTTKLLQSTTSPGSNSSPTFPLELQLGYYVQSITVPQLKMEEGEKLNTPLGAFQMNGRTINPDNNTLVMDILNTKAPLCEWIFYPWMRECTLPYWCYETQPYSNATITIDMTKHADIKYVFYGARPIQINTEQPTQEADTSLTRSVTFVFDFMYVTSDFVVNSSYQDRTYFGTKLTSEKKSFGAKALEAGKSLVNGATNYAIPYGIQDNAYLNSLAQ